jgi:hypothetical protein
MAFQFKIQLERITDPPVWRKNDWDDLQAQDCKKIRLNKIFAAPGQSLLIPMIWETTGYIVFSLKK